MNLRGALLIQGIRKFLIQLRRADGAVDGVLEVVVAALGKQIHVAAVVLAHKERRKADTVVRLALDEALEPDVDERIEAVVHHIDLGGRKRLGSGGVAAA